MTIDAAHIEALDVPSTGWRRRTGRIVVNRSSVESNRGLVDDDLLIGRVAGGDDAALRELLFRHGPWLAARLRALMPAADVEDVLQETFLAVWRGRAGIGRRVLLAAGCRGSRDGKRRCCCVAAGRRPRR